MVRQIFATLDTGRRGYLDSAAMRKFAETNGFDGKDAEWDEEFECMCEEWECEQEKGFSEAIFTQWVNDDTDKGCFCSDKELLTISVKLGVTPQGSVASVKSR